MLFWKVNCLLTFKLRTYAVWNGTIFDMETILFLTELFEIELIIWIKIDLALNNQ